MANPIIVTASTTLVQVDTSTALGPYVVLLSNLNRPGAIITIRDSAGSASLTNTVVISTVSSIKFLNGGGPSGNLYSINQPFGFITVTPKTSSIWGVVNTYAFPDGSQTANLFQVNVSSLHVSSFATMQQLFVSTGAISTICTNNLYVQGNIVYDQSTIGNVAFYTSTIYAKGDITTTGNLYVGSTLSTTFVNASSTIYAPFISTTNINMSGVLNTNSTISTAGPLFVGSSISTTGNLAVGASTFINGELTTRNLSITGSASIAGGLSVMSSLYTQGDIFTQSSITAMSSISTLHNVNMGGSLSTLGNAFIGREIVTNSSIFAGGSISTLQNLNVGSNMVINCNGTIGGSLSVFSTIGTVGISVRSNATIGGDLNVLGQMFLSNMSITGTLGVAGLATFGSSNDNSITANGGLWVKDKGISVNPTNGTNDSVNTAPWYGIGSANKFLGGSANKSVQLAGYAGINFVTAGPNLAYGSDMAIVANKVGIANINPQATLDVSGSVNVSGQTTLSNTSNTGTLVVAGSTIIGGSLSVFSSIATTNLNFTGALYSNGVLFTGGSSVPIFSTLSTVGQAAFYSSVQIQGSLSVYSSIAATDVNFTGGLYSNGILFTGGSGSPTFSTMSTIGQAAFYSSVQVQGSLSVFSSIAATDINFSGSLYSNGILFTGGSGSPTFSTMSTIGQAAFYSSVQIQGGLSVFSTIGAFGLSVQSNATIGGTLGVAGVTTLSNTSNTGTLGVAGLTTLSNTSNAGTLGVAGVTTLSNTSNTGTLGVAGLTTLSNTSNTGTLGVAGITTLSNTSNTGTLNVTGNTTMAASLSVFSSLTAYNINFTSSITSNGLPFSSGVPLTSSFAQVSLPMGGSRGICFDLAGNMYVGDSVNNVVYKVTPNGETSLIAGTSGANLFIDGSGSTALSQVWNMCFDVYSGWIIIGTVWCIRAVNPTTGQVITLCGSPSGPGNSNNQTGTAATFNLISGICSDGNGNLYVADFNNNNIARVSFSLPITANGGTKTIIAGSTATPGGYGYYNNATGTTATFANPSQLVINLNKTLLWVTDSANNVIRQISLTSPFAVTTFAGPVGSSATPGNQVVGSPGHVDQAGAANAGAVRFINPYGIAIDGSNNLYIVEYTGRYLRFINTTSFYTHTLAGNGTSVNTSGSGTNGRMAGPTSVTLDPYGNPWIVTYDTPAIFNYNMQTGYLNLFYTSTGAPPTPDTLRNTSVSTMIVPAVATKTLFGSDFTTFNSAVTYVSPQGLVMDSQNNLYVSDKFKVRKVTPSRFVTSIFGDPSNIQNTNQPFPGAQGEYNGSYQMCIDNSGNMYIANAGTSTINVVNLNTGAASNLAPTGQALNTCFGILFNAGILYVSNTNILASPPAGYIVAINLSTNTSTLIAGSTTVGALTNGNGTAARFNFIYGMCFDMAKENILICDRGNGAIRNYNISTTAVTTYSTGVTLPSFIAADNLGNYYATSGSSLFKIIAGTATSFSSGFADVFGITVDSYNNIYVSDVTNNCIYFITAGGTATVYSGVPGSSGTQDSLYASTLTLLTPYVGINKSNAQYTLDIAGSVNFSAGLYSNGILFSGGTSTFSTLNAYTINFTSSITSNGLPFTGGSSSFSTLNAYTINFTSSITSNGLPFTGGSSSFSTLNAYTINFTSSITSNGLPFTSGVSATSGFAQIAPAQLPLTNSCGICFDPSGNMYVADFAKYVIYKITPTGVISLFAGTYGLSGLADGIGSSALFGEIWNICYDSFSGCIMVASVPAIRAINLTTRQVTTLAGGVSGSADGTGASASFNKPAGICSDGAGALYIADCSNNNIRKLTFTLPITAASGVVTLFCGNATSSGYTNATGASAAFNAPSGIVINSAKTLLWVTDTNNHVIRQITVPGAIATTFAGANAPTVASGYVDSTVATSVRFNSPQSLTIDASDNLYIVEYLGNYLRFIDSSPFYTQTLAGNGNNSNVAGVGRNASMAGPTAIAFDPFGNPWIVAYDVPAIFNYSLQTGYLNLYFQATVTTGTPYTLQNTPISTIIVPAVAATTLFGSDFTALNSVVTYLSPQGLVMDSQNNLYVSDKFKLRKVAPSGFVTSVFGDPSNTQDGNQPGPGSRGQYNGAYQMCLDNSGNMYIADSGVSTVHVVNLTTGAVTNLAPTGQAIGNCFGVVFNAGILYVSNTNMTASPPAGYIVAVNLATNVGTLIAGSTTLGALTNANGTSARFNFIYGMCFDVAKANIFICDRGNGVIRQYNIATTAVTTYSSTVASFIASDSLGNYYATGGTSLFKIVGGTATTFSSGFSFVLGVTVDSFNNIYVSDILNNCIYFINPAGVASVYSGIAGITGTQDSIYGSTISLLTPYVGINKTNAQYNLDVGGSINFSGGLYSNGSLFFAATPPNMSLSTLSTLGQASFNSNVQIRGSLSVFSSISAYNMNTNGMNVNTLTANTGFAQITDLTLPSSRGICFDPSGNMYVNSSYLYTIYKITPQGVTSLLAGSYGLGGTTDGIGSAALFANSPQQMWYDSYTGCIAMATNSALRLISLTGVVTTIASGFSTHYGVCSDGAGNFYITDDHRVKRVTISSPTPAANSGTVTTIAGTTPSYINGDGATARFNGLYSIVINSSKTALYVADIGNNVIRQVNVASPFTVTTLAGAAPTGGPAAPSGTADSTTPTSVSFTSPVSMAIDASNNIFVGDYGNHRIRFINVSPFYTLTIGGNGTTGTLAGVGTNSQINTPHGMTIDPYGRLWVVTYNNGAIFNYNMQTGYFNLLFQNTNAVPKPVNVQIPATSTIVAPTIATGTIYGSGYTITNSNAANPGGATYQSPNGVLLDSQNNLYVCDNRRIRKISPSGLVTSVYGDVTNTQDTTQIGTGSEGVSNILYQSLCFDNSGNIYASQFAGNSILRINLATGVATNLAITGQALNGPNGMLFNNNILYVINENKGGSGFTQYSSYVVAINLATNVSVIVAGSLTNTAIFNWAFSMCFDSTKTNIYVSNYSNGSGNIRIIANFANTGSYPITPTTFATSGLAGLSLLYITSDNLGNFYGSGTYTGVPVTRGIIKITSAGVASSFCNTVTLNGATVNIGVPTGLAVDPYNNVYFADANRLFIGIVTPGGGGSVYSGANGTTGTQDSTYASSITFMAPFVGINNANPTNALHVNGNANIGVTNNQGAVINIGGGAGGGGTGSNICLSYLTGGYNHYIYTRHNSVDQGIHFFINNTGAGGSTAPGTGNINTFSIYNYGVFVSGTLSASGTKAFRIDHPILSNCKLAHTAIEGPRADLIYRNRKQLVNGLVEVDLEKESTSNGATMVKGTFDALATNPQVFLQNNDTFDRVKGYVSSHMLFIECENSNSTAFVDWMVTAERHDPSVIDDSLTDKNGFLILEHYVSTISTLNISSINVDFSTISTLDVSSINVDFSTISTIDM